MRAAWLWAAGYCRPVRQIENGCGGTATLSAPGSKLKGVSCGEMNENSSQLRDLEKSKFNENAESEVGLRYLSE
jgi:hypothetical protein